MYALTRIVAAPGAVWTSLVGVAGLLCVCIGVYWHFDRQAKLRMIAELQQRILDELYTLRSRIQPSQSALHLDDYRLRALELLSF